MRTVMVEYTLAPSADLAEVERHIRDFVAGIAALQIGVRYTSHRRPIEPGGSRSYAHLGLIPDEAAQAALTSAPFFATFSQFLRTVTAEPPRVSWLEVVATTAA